MSSVNNSGCNVHSRFDKCVEVVAFSVNKAEPLEKVAKIIDRVIRFAETLFGAISSAVTNFGTQLRDTIIVFETLRFVGVMNLLLTPKNGKYFLTDPNNSWQKRLDRVMLAFHTAFKMVKGFNKFGFVELGFMANNVIGKLPIFTLVMDSFIIASSFFSSWDSIANNLPRARGDIAKAEAKLDKWKNRPASVAYVRVNDPIELNACKVEYEKKAGKLDKTKSELVKIASGESTLSKTEQASFEKKCGVKGKTLSEKISNASVKLAKIDGRLEKIANNNFKGLAADLEKANASFKLKKWEAMKSNAKQDRTKTWFAIANAIGKIAVVVFALTVAATNAWAIVPVSLSLLAMGIVVDSIGLIKVLQAEFLKHIPIPEPTDTPKLELQTA